MCFQQRSRYVPPLCIERLPTDGPACPAIPVRRVVLIALLAMQVSMNPRPLGTFVLLGGLVRAIPIAPGLPPQPGKGVRESGWRLRRGERLAKFVQGHVSLLCSAAQMFAQESSEQEFRVVSGYSYRSATIGSTRIARRAGM